MKQKLIITIKKYNALKFLSSIQNKVEIFCIQNKDDMILFEISRKDKKKISTLCKQNSVPIIKIHKNFFCSFVSQIFCPACVIALIFCSVLWTISTFFVTNIAVYGQFDFSRQQVCELLEKYKSNKIIAKSSIDTKKIEQELQEIAYISYASVTTKGNSLVISIKEQLTNEEFICVGDHMPIISSYDGVITSIAVYQGTIVKKVGDIVKVGDVLVQPYALSGDGSTTSVQPLASITLDIFLTEERDVTKQELCLKQSGNKVSDVFLSVNNVVFFSSSSSIPYQKYQTKENKVYMSKTLIPIVKTTKTYYELVYDESTNIEKAIQDFSQKLYQINLQKTSKYEIIKKQSCSVIQNDGLYTIVQTLCVSRKIC